MRTLELRCLCKRPKVVQLSDVDENQTLLDVTLKLPRALLFHPVMFTRIQDFNYCVNRNAFGREMTPCSPGQFLRVWKTPNRQLTLTLA